MFEHFLILDQLRSCEQERLQQQETSSATRGPAQRSKTEHGRALIFGLLDGGRANEPDKQPASFFLKVKRQRSGCKISRSQAYLCLRGLQMKTPLTRSEVPHQASALISKVASGSVSLIRDAPGLIKQLPPSPKQTLGTAYLTSD